MSWHDSVFFHRTLNVHGFQNNLLMELATDFTVLAAAWATLVAVFAAALLTMLTVLATTLLAEVTTFAAVCPPCFTTLDAAWLTKLVAVETN